MLTSSASMVCLHEIGNSSDFALYLDKVALPAFFVVLGAVIGFLANQAKDALDERRSKSAFLRAMGRELSALETLLQESIPRTGLSEKISAAALKTPPILFGTFQNAVLSTQLAGLRDLSDPLLMEIVQLYARLDSLDKTVAQMNGFSQELFRSVGSQQQVQLREALNLSLTSTFDQLKQCLGLVQCIGKKLPRPSRK